jgi:hypothetical protein
VDEPEGRIEHLDEHNTDRREGQKVGREEAEAEEPFSLDRAVLHQRCADQADGRRHDRCYGAPYQRVAYGGPKRGIGEREAVVGEADMA